VKKLAIIAGVVIVVAAVAYFIWGRAKPQQDEASQTTTAAVTRGAVKLTVVSNGRVVANLDVDIKCKASGAIIKLPFDVSDPVKKGDLLLELDPVDQGRILKQTQVALEASESRLVTAQVNLAVAERALGTDRARAEANLNSAEVQAKDARSKADRENDLLAAKLASQEEYDTAETAAVQAASDLKGAKIKMDELATQEQALELSRQQVKLAEAEVEGDKIAESVAEDRLADTKVVAPMDGVVSARNVQIGQIISSAVSNVGGGTTVLTLSDLSHVFVLASVDESDIGKVAVGQAVSITADAYPGKEFDGSVVRIATTGVNASSVVTFEVKIEVTSSQKSLLKPEMTTIVEILCAENKDALLVPADAVVTKQGKRYVTVASGQTSTDQEVETGISDGVKTEILSGIKEGDVVSVHKGASESRWTAQQQQQRPAGFRPGMFGGGGGR
jgi:HlyD family secretion protein